MNAIGGIGPGTSQTPKCANLRLHKQKALAGSHFLVHRPKEFPSSCDLCPRCHKCQARSHPPCPCYQRQVLQAGSPNPLLLGMERSVGQKAATRDRPGVQSQRWPPKGSPCRYSLPPNYLSHRVLGEHRAPARTAVPSSASSGRWLGPGCPPWCRISELQSVASRTAGRAGSLHPG